MIMKITNHANNRGKKRLGFKGKALEKKCELALLNGLKQSDAKGSLKRFLDGLYLKHRNANGIRVYEEYCYLFRGSTLLTIIHLPNQYKKYLT